LDNDLGGFAYIFLTRTVFAAKRASMKQLTSLTILLCLSAALAATVVAGPEPLPSGKEMKQVAPAPPECNWSGFYIGLNVGGQFGHSETEDLDGYWYDGGEWGYDESGVIAGGQVGYNFQWNWLVLGVEAEGGYMNLDGSGVFRHSDRFPEGPDIGSSDSDFFTTIRGRIGFAFGRWMFYGTGGGIGVNYETRNDDSPEDFHAHEQSFDWGWTGGGGIEYMLGCHWSIRAEYLRFELDRQGPFSDIWSSSAPFPGPDLRYRFEGVTAGNIIRAALNYKF
jgi:outer membrane immunogenic protein